MNQGMLTSNKQDWETPQAFFDELDREFHFSIDVAATKENAKCETFFTEKENGLVQNWFVKNPDYNNNGQPESGVVWCNPPYNKQIGKWVRKASDEAQKGVTTVMLIPSRTETRWFHEYIYNKENVEIRSIKGRLRFSGASVNAPFPSMIVVFHGLSLENNRT